MEIIKGENFGFTSEQIEKAADRLKQGGVIVYPTETAYGLGVNALDEGAIRKVFRIKGRDFRKPLSIMVSGLEMANQYAAISDLAASIFHRFLPGPLTLVLPKKNNLPDLLTGKSRSVGIRVSPHPAVTSLMIRLSFPLTATSANISGGKNVYSLAEFQEQLRVAGVDQTFSSIDLFLDAGILPPSPPSTVLDLTVNPPKILRPGPIRREQIENELGFKLAD